MIGYLTVLVLCVTGASATGQCAPHEDMLKMLNIEHNSASYAHLSAASKALIPELLATAQSCQLTQFVYSNGLYKVFDLLNEMIPTDAHYLNSYLKKHLELENRLIKAHPASTTR